MRESACAPLPPGTHPRARTAGFTGVSVAALAVVACQVTTVATDEEIGAISNACLVVVLALAASVRRPEDSIQAPYLALSLLPLLALARLIMPQNSIETDVWELVVALPVMVGAALLIAMGREEERRPVRPTLSKRWQLAIVLSGAPIGLLAFGLGSVAGENRGSAGLAVALVLFLAGCADEVLFRGVLQRALESTYGRGSFIVSALLYTAMLLGNAPVAVAVGGVLGFAFGYLVARTNALFAAAATHGVVNVFWGVLAPHLF
jgi:membrane protease YdiL (CAAX protease family)